MNYSEALEYIHGINWTFCKPGLERIEELCNVFGNPQKKLKFVHVVGTNGKGSFCSMLSSVLQEAGYKVGLYTSPYITCFNERMRINGENISNSELISLVEKIRPFAESMKDKPTEFELITAIAFEYFLQNKCDIVVLEAGMGGRLDSTNVIDNSLLSVITGIALDHTAFLGDTIEKIAAEKAGIIKKSSPVLFGNNDASAAKVIESKCIEQNSQYFALDTSSIKIISAELNGTVFDFGKYKNVKIKLLGEYQPYNSALVIRATEILNNRGLQIQKEALYRGLENASWPARFEILSEKPTVIFDGAHNPQGISAAVKSIKRYFKNQKVYVLTGVLHDKDYLSIAKDLSEICSKAFVLTPENKRAFSAFQYSAVLSELGISTEYTDNNEKTIEIAFSQAKKDAIPLVCLGSLYLYSTVAPIIKKLK